MLKMYSYLQPGLKLTLNGKNFVSKNGLMDLLAGVYPGDA